MRLLPIRPGAPLLVLAVALVASGPPAAAAGPPQVLDSWASEVTATSARLHAEANANGLATTLRFEYLSAAAYQANLDAVPPRDPFTGAAKAPPGAAIAIGSGTLAQHFQQQPTGLAPATAYRYRAVAINSVGTASGPLGAFTTEDRVPAFVLPDGRGWEMVSPVDKNGGEVEGAGENFGGGVLQAAAGGEAVTFTSSSSFGAAQGAPGASQYLARRGPGGWATENISLPTHAGAFGDDPDGVPYKLFSPGLSRALALVEPHSYLLLATAPSLGVLAPAPVAPDLTFAGADPELGLLVLSTCAALTADAVEVAGPEGCDPAATNLYRWANGSLALLNLLPGDTQGTPGARLAAPAGAVFAAGPRVYWTGADGNLYLRDGGETKWVDGAAGGGGTFETASADGAIAFFTRADHLFRYTAATQATTDLTPAGGVLGVLGASADGTHVYYATAAGLYLHHGAGTTAAAADAAAANYPPASGSARVSADGTRLAFLSAASLTGYDNHGATEAYLYDAGAASLICASCNPTGARATSDASIPGAHPNGSSLHPYKARALAAGGRRLFFETGDALVPLDTNNDSDVYQWEQAGTGGCAKPAGCIALISSGRAEGGASFLDASESGDDAFFLTDGSLVPSDPGAVDVYVARVGGGFPLPPTPIPCVGDACQPLPPEPEDPSPGTMRASAETNPPLRYVKPKRQRAHRTKRNHKQKHRRPSGRAHR